MIVMQEVWLGSSAPRAVLLDNCSELRHVALGWGRYAGGGGGGGGGAGRPRAAGAGEGRRALRGCGALAAADAQRLRAVLEES